MREIFKKSHAMTRKIVKEFKVNYQAQFGLCLNYLLKNREASQMRTFEWKMKDGSDFKIEFEDEPIIRKAEPFIGWMNITNAWINGEEIKKDKHGKLYKMMPAYKWNGEEDALAIEVKHDACKDVLKKMKSKRKLSEINILTSKEFKVFYEEEFAPKIEVGIAKVKQDIKDSYEKAYRELKDTDIIKFKRHSSYGYSFNSEYDKSDFFVEAKKALVESEINIDKYIIDEDRGDYTITTYYRMTLLELKKQIIKANKLIEKKEEAENNRELLRKDREKRIFQKAKVTKEKQEIGSWIEPCNDPCEDCDVDHVVIWAMPDGSTKTTRHHTW